MDLWLFRGLWSSSLDHPCKTSDVCALSAPVSDGEGMQWQHWVSLGGCGHMAGRRLLGKQTCRSVHTAEMCDRTEKTQDCNMVSRSNALCVEQSGPWWGWELLLGKEQSGFSKSSPATPQCSGPGSFGTSVGAFIPCASEDSTGFCAGVQQSRCLVMVAG